MDRRTAWASGAILGATGAGLYLAILSDAPGALILAYLAQLPLFAAGLWAGTVAAAVAGVVASVLVAIVGGWATTALFAGLYAAPVVLLVRQALLARPLAAGSYEWYPAGLLTAWLAGLGLLVLAAVMLFLGGPHAIATRLDAMLAPLLDRLPDEAPFAKAGVALFAFVVPGCVAASWMAMTAGNAILAQGVLARFGKAWRPSPDLASLSLPWWLSGLLAAAVVLALFGGGAGFVGVNLLVTLSVPFCLAGLAVVHTAVRRSRHPQLPLVLFYVAAGLFGWPLLLTAVLGALDAPLGLRRRLAPSRSFGGDR
jgi:hypothetical protein